MRFSRYHIAILILIFILGVLFAGCTSSLEKKSDSAGTQSIEVTPDVSLENSTSWMNIPITDAISGKKTSIVELASQGKPVIIHTFAVWCPACSMQLRETTRMAQENPDTFVILGVDIDPRENSAMVKNHVEKNKFTGTFIAAPPEMTRSLIKTVGDQIVRSLPQTIIICNKSVTYVGDGVFPEQKLRKILSELCS